MMLLPLATPEIVMGSALFLVFTNLYTAVPLGRTAQVLGHVTFSISYVVVIVRSRLLSVGGEYETAARDLGASPLQAIRTVLIPLLMPSVFAAAMIVFAASMDDFVVSSFLSADASSATVPIKLYSGYPYGSDSGAERLATLLLVGSILALLLAWLVLRRVRRGPAATPSTTSRHRHVTSRLYFARQLPTWRGKSRVESGHLPSQPGSCPEAGADAASSGAVRTLRAGAVPRVAGSQSLACLSSARCGPRR
jgi:ABC-type Fe3+ transport system permease subunit